MGRQSLPCGQVKRNIVGSPKWWIMSFSSAATRSSLFYHSLLSACSHLVLKWWIVFVKQDQVEQFFRHRTNMLSLMMTLDLVDHWSRCLFVMQTLVKSLSRQQIWICHHVLRSKTFKRNVNERKEKAVNYVFSRNRISVIYLYLYVFLKKLDLFRLSFCLSLLYETLMWWNSQSLITK